MSSRKRNFTITKLEETHISSDNEYLNDFGNDFDTDNINKNIIVENTMSIDEQQLKNIDDIQNDISYEKLHIHQYIDEIDTIVINSKNIYTLSVIGFIDKIISKYNFKIQNVKNYISSSFGTIVSLYLAFDYSPKDILLIFFEKLKLNGNILNIIKSYGVFDLDIFIDELLKPLFDKLGYVPTISDIHDITKKNIVFLSYNLTLHKTVYFNLENNPNDKIDTIVKTCCNIPIIFTKYLHKEQEYIDYTFIFNKIEDNLYNNIIDFSFNKKLSFNTNTIKNTHNDIKNMNIVEYIFCIFETISNQDIQCEIPIKSTLKEINITIDIHSYDIVLFLDITQRYKELIKLYNYGFDKICDYVILQNHNTKKQICNEKEKRNFSGVVFAGGGINTSIISGMYKCLYDLNMISQKNIKTLIGTSAGSLISCFIAMGFEPIDTINFYCEFNFAEIVYNSLKNISIIDSIKNKGILNNNIMLNNLENIFIKYNNGIIPTLLDVKNKYDKELVCVTYNITKNKLEYLNYKNSPDLLVTHAGVMSSCIPILFNPFEYKNNLYLDGFMGSNFPIECTSEYKDLDFACFKFDTKIYDVSNNILEYIMKILYEKINVKENEKIELNTENCECFIYNKKLNNNPITSNKKEMMKLYDNGYKLMFEILKKREK